MQIHEITKRQRTDEGLLDKVKNTISAVKTKTLAAGDRWQEKQWDKTQDKRNKQAADAAKVLARKGFNVDTTTPLARAQTPTRVKQQQQQKIAQLQQAFDQEFDIKSGGGGPVATDDDAEGIKVTANNGTYSKDAKGQWTNELGKPVTDAKSIAYLNQLADKQYTKNPAAVPPISKTQPVQPTAANATPQPPVKEAQINPNRLATMKARAKSPGVTQPNNDTSKKDIAKDFNAWISQHIPGLENVAPEVKTKLNSIFQKMAAAKDPKSIDAAFQQYADLALSSVGDVPQNQQGQQAQGVASPSARYAQGAIATQLGITPETIAKLQQRIAQNKEQINNTHTGSETIDKLIQAVTKK